MKRSLNPSVLKKRVELLGEVARQLLVAGPTLEGLCTQNSLFRLDIMVGIRNHN